MDSGTFDLKQLCIHPGKFCWNLYVDLLVLDSGGSLADTLTVAALAALTDCHLPRLRVVRGESEEDVDVEVEDSAVDTVVLDCSSTPLLLSFLYVSGQAVVDARLEEETCASARVQVAINRYVSPSAPAYVNSPCS